MKKPLSSLLIAATLFSNTTLAAEETEKSCLNSWKNIIKGDITVGEATTNAVVLGTGALSVSASSKVSATVKSVAKFVLIGGAIGVVLLSANEQWQIMDRLFAQALVGTGELLSDISEVAAEAGKNYSATQIADVVKSLDIENDFFSKYMCTDENRPVILGRYIQMIFENLDQVSK